MDGVGGAFEEREVPVDELVELSVEVSRRGRRGGVRTVERETTINQVPY